MSNSVLTYRNEAMKEEYYKLTHKSGLTVLVYPKALSTAYVMFTTKYGSLERTFRREGEDFITVPDGVAHFLEHKLFEEADGSDAFARFAPLGASANAFTSFEMTSYLFSTTDRLDEALAVLLDFVTHPYFTEKSVAKEQGIIAQEIGMGLDNPGNRLYYSLLEGLYRNHNIRVEIAGTEKSIAKITPEILYRCYETFYQLSNMVLVVCGNTTLEDVMRTVDATLPQEAAARPIECKYPEEDERIARPYTELRMSVATPLFAFGVKDTRTFATPEERVRYALLAEILGKCYFSRSADFYNRLYDEGLIVKDIGCYYESFASCAYLMITGESERPDEVYAITKDLLQNISRNLPTEQDFERIKRVIYADYIRTFDSTESLAMALTDCHLRGTEFLSEGDVIHSLSYAEFLRFATTFFDGKEFTLSVIYPSTKEEEEK